MDKSNSLTRCRYTDVKILKKRSRVGTRISDTKYNSKGLLNIKYFVPRPGVITSRFNLPLLAPVRDNSINVLKVFAAQKCEDGNADSLSRLFGNADTTD